MYVELVLSKPAVGVTNEQVRDAAFAVSPVLESLSGLLHREVLSDMNGQWIDLIHWDTKESSEKALPTVGHLPVVQDLFSKLDPAVEMMFLTPVRGSAIPATNPAIVEVALFRTLPGVNELSMNNAIASTWDMLAAQPGYMSRELLRTQDGQWADVIHWSTMDNAIQAMETLEKDERMQSFMKCIDVTTLRMLHVERIHVYALA